MTWTYSGDPSVSEKDAVRFLVGDTDIEDQLVQDEEILYALSQYLDIRLASAYVCYAIAAKFSTFINSSVGQVSASASDIAKAYKERAKDLDPSGSVVASYILAVPSFGGRSYSEKEVLNSDNNAVQPSFFRGMNDIPGGPSDGDDEDPEWLN